MQLRGWERGGAIIKAGNVAAQTVSATQLAYFVLFYKWLCSERGVTGGGGADARIVLARGESVSVSS